MGYNTLLSGGLTFDPPLSVHEFANSPYTQFGDAGSWLFKVEEMTKVVPYTDDKTKAYDIETELQAFVDSMPGATFTGFIGGEGEENGDMWRIYVRAGRVDRVTPTITWPSEEGEI